MNEKQNCCNLDCPVGKVPPPRLTQPCISLLELFNDKNCRKVGSAGNSLSSRKMVVGEQIAIIVTILNTKRLS